MNAVKNDTSGGGYCGPIAVAAITGKPLSEVLDAFRDVMHPRWRWERKRKPPIKGTSTFAVRAVLVKLGYLSMPVVIKYPIGPNTPIGVTIGPDDKLTQVLINPPTLAALLRYRTREQRSACLLIEVTKHWVVVQGNKFVDTKTKGQPVWTGDAPGRRKRVQAVWQVAKR